MMPIIQVSNICERDIDLLLLEEFISSSEFQSWFLSKIGIKQTASLIEARRSVMTNNGESDLELTFQDCSERLKILIENKVDAAFQPNQSQRYAERAEQYRNNGSYRKVLTILMAPRIYFDDEDSAFGFDARVTYEDALIWFQQSGIGARKDYKVAILQGAIKRGRLGWKLIPHRNVCLFWQEYWKICEKIAPQLSMPVPKNEIPADSSFIRFNPSSLPAGVSLWHKVAHGHVDLQFANMGDKLIEMERLYRPLLLPPMRIEKAAKSSVIRIRVKQVDMTTAAFSSAEMSIRQGIHAASLLLDWFSRIQQS